MLDAQVHYTLTYRCFPGIAQAIIKVNYIDSTISKEIIKVTVITCTNRQSAPVDLLHGNHGLLYQRQVRNGPDTLGGRGGGRNGRCPVKLCIKPYRLTWWCLHDRCPFREM
jgi:hypothetical protein